MIDHRPLDAAALHEDEAEHALAESWSAVTEAIKQGDHRELGAQLEACWSLSTLIREAEMEEPFYPLDQRSGAIPPRLSK